jgi:Fanconi-associated nuclease 1
MIFALVMWDVLYAPVDGAFETPFQSAPLDLGEDSFAISALAARGICGIADPSLWRTARAPQIRERLALIEETGGLALIREADERERPRRSFAIGCRWDLYTQQDLLEIAEVRADPVQLALHAPLRQPC